MHSHPTVVPSKFSHSEYHGLALSREGVKANISFTSERAEAWKHGSRNHQSNNSHGRGEKQGKMTGEKLHIWRNRGDGDKEYWWERNIESIFLDNDALFRHAPCRIS